VGPRAGLDTEATGKILSPLSGIELRSPSRPVCSQTLYRLSYHGFTVVWNVQFKQNMQSWKTYTFLLTTKYDDIVA
jgi:hypothetical protein